MNNTSRAPTPNEETASRIRGLMAQQKKTTTALAEHLKISRQAAGRKTGGSTALTVDEVHSIAIWLGAHPVDLIGGEAWTPSNGPH